MIDGACLAVDSITGEPISEKKKLQLLGIDLEFIKPW
jgi:hypothetical protein